ncbi:MAG: hypothetical protein M1826_007466 [Phylliscum demangeonii]|nr:MAG: hypothetical protein M1826_007466 [Phylliscum demangeonii]
MASGGEGHHHRSTTKVYNKPFKSRHATKSLLKAALKGRIEERQKGQRRTPHQQVMSKLDRRNQARQNQLKRRQDSAAFANVFAGRKGAPKIVAIVPLCKDGDARAAVTQLNTAYGIKPAIPDNDFMSIEVERFKFKVQHLMLQRQLVPVLDGCRVADFVVLLLSAHREVDAYGEHLLRCIESQGLTNVVTMVQNLA